MKTIYKLIGSVLVLTGITTTISAQSTATASTTAVLVTPISISKTTDMHFGIVAASATSGTVELDYADGRTATGGVTLPVSGGSEKTAVFAVVGEASSTFSIALPTAAIVLDNGAGANMTVDNFEADLGTTGTLNGSGAATIKVKAILNVGANQVAGTYVNANDLFVTVNYN